MDLDHSCKKKAKKSSQNFKTNHLFERAVHSHGKNSLREWDEDLRLCFAALREKLKEDDPRLISVSMSSNSAINK